MLHFIAYVHHYVTVEYGIVVVEGHYRVASWSKAILLLLMEIKKLGRFHAIDVIKHDPKLSGYWGKVIQLT